MEKSERIYRLVKILYPGIRIKRWILLGTFGVATLSAGLTYLLRRALLATRSDDQNILPDLLPWHFDGILLLFFGTTLILWSIFGLYQTISPLLAQNASLENIGDILYRRRALKRGPKIVAIGGGTGLSVLLSGLKNHTDNLTAIIGVTDDGGSSGRLRRDLGVLPPGDFRNCIVAMSDESSLLQELFQYRFPEGSELKGHSFGNLFITAMSEISNGFENGISESSKVLAVRGSIAPATVNLIQLSATLESGEHIVGESEIRSKASTVSKIYIDPPDAQAYDPVIKSILGADTIILGPGSLYTSVLPNLLVHGIAEALCNTNATKIYICNVATEIGETGGYDLSKHVEALQKHTFSEVVDYVIANDNITEIGDRFAGESVKNIPLSDDHIVYVYSDIVDIDNPVRHDSGKLSQVIMELVEKDKRTKSVR